MERVKEVAKSKNIQMQTIADSMGIQRQTLTKKLKTVSLSTLQEVSQILNCDVHELLECGTGFAHFYDPETGEWLGIRKK